MKALTFIAVACSVIATSAIAGQGHGHGHNGYPDHGYGNGWGSGINVYPEIPMSEAAARYRQAPQYSHCREARHICFDRWGVREPGYGNCIWDHGC